MADLRQGAVAARLAKEARRAPRSGPGELASGPGRTKSALAVAAMLAGVALVATAAVAFATSAPDTAPASRAAPAGDASTAPAGPDTTLTDAIYAPGHSSGWHVHPGVHSVVVLAGTLTIYDEHCQRHEFGPGSSYLGGSQPHLARNDTGSELDVVITSVYERSTLAGHGSVVSSPAGCDAR